jgi:hypothetical protein
MKTNFELSKFNISMEEDEKGVVTIVVTKDGENIDEMVFDADEYNDTKSDDNEEEEEEEAESKDAEKESDIKEVNVGECLSFDKFMDKKVNG